MNFKNIKSEDRENYKVALKLLATIAALEIITIAIISITDLKGKITYVNNNFCEISGFSQEELIAQVHRIINSGFHNKEFYWVSSYNRII